MTSPKHNTTSTKILTPSHPHASIVIPNKKLLTMSVNEIDSHIEWVKFYCVDLTRQDLNRLYAQRKKVVNREYARLSRIRKKYQLERYMEEIERLREENAALKDKVTRLEASAITTVKQEHPLFEMDLL
jgi:hypothetical protein